MTSICVSTDAAKPAPSSATSVVVVSVANGRMTGTCTTAPPGKVICPPGEATVMVVASSGAVPALRSVTVSVPCSPLRRMPYGLQGETMPSTFAETTSTSAPVRW